MKVLSSFLHTKQGYGMDSPQITVHSFMLRIVILLVPHFLSACQATTPTHETTIQTPPATVEITPTLPRPSTILPPPSVRFEHLSVEDGLAHSEVAVILQDHLGFMWFGTQNGLNKYDGHRFITYRNDPDDKGSLQDNFIESLYEDSSGTLWVGTQDGWLERFDRRTGSFAHYAVSSHVYSITEGAEGDLWLGSKDPGLLRFDPETGNTQTIWAVEDVISIVLDDVGRIWAASPGNGLGRFDPQTGRLTVIRLEHSVHELALDSKGHLWLGTWGGGLGYWDEAEDRVQYLTHDPEEVDSPGNDYISTLHIGMNDALWIGTYESGLDRFDISQGSFMHFMHDPTDAYSLSRDLVHSIYQDRSGIVWIGLGVGGGVNRLSVGADRFGHYRPLPDDPNSLSSDLVTSISGDRDGVLWFGTFTGLDRWDQATGVWRNYHYDPDDVHSLIDNSVRSVHVDMEGTLWVGTEGGLERYDPAIDGFIHLGGPTVMWMHEGRSGRFWMATKGGFFEFDRARNELILIDEGYAWKIMVIEDDQGRVWVGSSGDGVGLYTPDSGIWTFFSHDPENPTSLSDDFVETIHQDQSSRLWFGTGDGLNLYDEELGGFIRYLVKDGLTDDRIAGMLEDDQGNLWLSTNGGLSRFDLETKTFENFTVRDGLQSNIFWRNAYYKSPNGMLFFAGDNGFNAFHPEDIVANPQVPPVVITRVSLFNRPLRTDLPNGEKLNFNYNENFLSFDFAALDYTDPGQNQYAYQMVGLDPEWVQAGNRRHADYPDLRPGTYTFRVIGSNNDGVWNESGASVQISIQPPFWATGWFIGLVILGVAVAGYGVYRLRVRSLEARGRQLAQEVEARTAELRDTNVQLQEVLVERERAEQALAHAAAEAAVREERDRLARDLHDSVTQSIYSSTLLAEAGQRHAAGGDAEQARMTLQRLGQITQQALKEMRLLVYELRPFVLEEVGLIAALQGRLDAVERRAGIDARLVVDEGLVLDPEGEAAAYYLTHEALNNALKHAAPGRVEVVLAPIVRAGCRLTITDDGSGFDPAEAESSGGLGLVSMRERVEALRGTFELETAPGAGTTITVTLPGEIDGD
jgi:signal transduction histidine kinase/ligand-binding sensor domain-containing protein